MVMKQRVDKKTVERTADNVNKCYLISHRYFDKGDRLEALSWEYKARWKCLKMQVLLEEDIMRC